MYRRRFLAAIAGCALATVARPARAASRIRSIAKDDRGTTLFMELDHAPFPAPNAGYRDNTVIAFVPAYYRFSSRESVSAVVHFHGHSTTAERAMVAHELRGQLHDSKQNAVLLIPQGPVNCADSSIGKLELPLGFASMMDDALATLTSHEARVALGNAELPEDARLGTVCLSAHSGGYHAAACCLRHGGVEVSEVYLFDALYNESDVFRDWVIRGKGLPLHQRHKLVSYYTEGTTAAVTHQLFAELEKAGVLCASEMVEGTLSREELSKAEAVSIRTALWHNRVTYETNSMRDCLFASALRRHVRSSWFSNKTEARRLDRRN